MTVTTRTARRLAVAALVLAAIAAAVIAGLVTSAAEPQRTAQPAQVAQAAPQLAVVTVDHTPRRKTTGPVVSAAGRAFLAQLAPDADLTPAQARRLVRAGERVCEGWAAGVPVAVMTGTLVRQLGLTGAEARQLVDAATAHLCAAA